MYEWHGVEVQMQDSDGVCDSFSRKNGNSNKLGSVNCVWDVWQLVGTKKIGFDMFFHIKTQLLNINKHKNISK